MHILKDCVIVISDNGTYANRICPNHQGATQKIIDNRFDGLNIKEDAGSDYIGFVCDRYNIVLIHSLNNIMQIFFPVNLNDYQLDKLNRLKNYINEYNLLTLLKYNNNYYRNFDQVLNLLRGEIRERKRNK